MSGGRGGSQAGFALVVALWAVAVIGLAGMGYVAAARTRVTATGAIGEHARLMALAEGAAASAAAGLVAERAAGRFTAPRRPLDGTSVACSPAQGVAAMVAVEDEAGKVNLNLAPPELIAAVLAVAGASDASAAAVMSGVLAARARALAPPPAETPARAADGRRREDGARRPRCAPSRLPGKREPSRRATSGSCAL